ncbi:hypothetical protein WA171_005852 [Blastocystis sp. BT1]
MQRARALYQFDGAVSSDLPLREGEIVTIINKLPGNLWWVGESADGRIGTFPYNYVEELPPEPEFEEFIGKKGISNLDIIQFDKVSQDGDQSITTILCHIIAGNGDYIAELTHNLFLELEKAIRCKYPLLYIPNLPTATTPRDLYKGIVHDFFAYFAVHQMVTPVILKWLQPIPRTRIAPCPRWKVHVNTTNIITEDEENATGRKLISVQSGEEYVLIDIEDGQYLLLEGNGKDGYCDIRYCEIVWMDSFKDEGYSPLERIIPFSMPSLQCSDDLRINHITMQTLRMNDRYGRHPDDTDTVVLRVHLYIWNSIRGYMYQFFNTNKNPIYHVIGKSDNNVITELIDHKLKLMRQGEKTMIIMRSSTDAPKEVTSFMENCKEFYLCYVIDLRLVQRIGDGQRNATYMLMANPTPTAPQVRLKNGSKVETGETSINASESNEE